MENVERLEGQRTHPRRDHVSIFALVDRADRVLVLTSPAFDYPARVLWRGAGLKVGRNARAGTLRSAMHRVLSEPAFRVAARRVAAGMAGDDDDSAPREIEAVVTHADAHASVRS